MLFSALLTSTLLLTSAPAPLACDFGDDSPCGIVLDALMLLWVSDDCAGLEYYPASVLGSQTGHVSIGACVIPTIPTLDSAAVLTAWVRLTVD